MTIVKAKIPSLVLGIFALGLVIFSFGIKPSSDSVERRRLSPPEYLAHFAVGYKEIIADIMWVRTIQDLDYCDSPQSEGVCRNNSWLYKMIDVITDLSPHFRMPYSAGALALTVVISDIEGATKIFDKSLVAFPNDWQFLYRAAYQYLYEVKDKKMAADLLIRAGRNGAPPWVFSLAGRLYSDDGHIELAQRLLQQMIEEKQDPQYIKRLQDKIRKYKEEGPSAAHL